MVTDAALVGVALLGCVAGALLGLVPGLHVYAVAGGVLLALGGDLGDATGETAALFLFGMVIGWSVVNVVPSVFLFAPDEASAALVLPSTQLLMRGKGAEAAMLVGAGSVGAFACLALLSPILDEVLRPVRAIIAPHTGWMLLAVIVFMVMGEWPRADDRAERPLARLASAWAYLGAGVLTFVLSGVLGLVLMYRSPVPIEASFQNLLPAFAGLFAIPGLIQTLAVGRRVPRQHAGPVDLPAGLLMRGTLTGVAGGLFAGVMPVVSGGIGGLLAGHATAQRDDRLFLVSQGASKVAYYVGGLLLLYVPGLALTRGGMAWMISTSYAPYGWRSYALALAAMALCGALGFTLLVLFTRVTAAMIGRVSPKPIAACALAVTVGMTLGVTGVPGLAVAAVATGIGLLPVFVGGRRMNCLGVLLVPITLNIVGVGPAVAAWLGLL